MARTEAIASSLALHRLVVAAVALQFKPLDRLKTLALVAVLVAVAVARAAAQAVVEVLETQAAILAALDKTLATVAAVVVVALLLPVLPDLLQVTAATEPLHLSPVRL